MEATAVLGRQAYIPRRNDRMRGPSDRTASYSKIEVIRRVKDIVGNVFELRLGRSSSPLVSPGSTKDKQAKKKDKEAPKCAKCKVNPQMPGDNLCSTCRENANKQHAGRSVRRNHHDSTNSGQNKN